MKSTVSIRETGYRDAGTIVPALLDRSGLSFRGMKVLVKPNILLGKPPEAGATTHPSVVEAAVRRLLDAGADVTVGDNPGLSGYGASMAAAKKCGLFDASLGRYKNIGAETVKVRTVSKTPREILISKAVLDADIIVNLPKLKTHGLAIYTGAVKNMFGMVVGADKARTHALAPTPQRFGGALVDIFAIRPPDLSIMDGVLGMEGNGPNAGTPRRADFMGMSRDAVALDSVCCRIIGIPPASVPHLREAAARGLGAIDPDGIVIDGRLPRIKPFTVPITRRLDRFGDAITGVVQRTFMSAFTGSADLRLIRERCTKCGACVRSCPTAAMSAGADGMPSIDKKLCISCYCCHELCAEDAWTFTGVRRLMGMFG